MKMTCLALAGTLMFPAIASSAFAADIVGSATASKKDGITNIIGAFFNIVTAGEYKFNLDVSPNAANGDGKGNASLTVQIVGLATSLLEVHTDPGDTTPSGNAYRSFHLDVGSYSFAWASDSRQIWS